MKSRKRNSQFEFEGIGETINEFGGSLLKNSHAKHKRPITTKRTMHLVMRSSHAKGVTSLLTLKQKIEALIDRQGVNHGIKIYRKAIATNHIHLIILPRSRDAYTAFIKSISGLIARLVLKIKKGLPKGIRFWDQRPFTRVVEWGRDFTRLCGYLFRNRLEAKGFIDYIPRTPRGKRFIQNQDRKFA